MNAVEFVKKYGWEEGKRILSNYGNNGFFCKEAKFLKIKIQNSLNDNFDQFHTISLPELKNLVESYELVGKLGLKRSKLAIENNALDASYISIWGTYYRYGANSLHMVSDGKWKEIYTGMDSNNLVHLDALKIALADVEKCQ